MKIIKRFWKYVDKQGPDECWEWLGTISKYGYGHLNIKGKTQQAHRASWAIANKTWPIPAGKMICHTCDNKACINPAHLYLGDNTTNMRDKSSLTSEDVREIRKLNTEGYALWEIGHMFNKDLSTIGRICRNETWKDV